MFCDVEEQPWIELPLPTPERRDSDELKTLREVMVLSRNYTVGCGEMGMKITV
uniref:Uncharacterized protein n=1 Tax=Anopheles christyi TaxID=43041 RepID=A0A182KHW9_9DIPT